MSANSIARWNALPFSRQEEFNSNLKRPRSEDEQDDDDISIASRTPSPPPSDAMDVDGESLSKYDEYVRGTTREVITVETKIKATNKGFAMLSKLGWSEGQPLGLSGDGRVEPIPFHVKRDLTGLGKTNQDVRMIETTVSQRRGLDSERQQKETEEQRRAREDSVARRTALQSEISDTLKAFYCTLCDKQFKNVAQYDEHTNSYAHHHKARFKDMQANVRIPKDEVDKRKEKERRREEKELRKIAAAAGIKMVRPPAAAPTVPSEPVANANNTSVETESKPSGFRKSGWISSSATETPTLPDTQSTFKRSGWATVGSTSSDAPHPEPPRSSGGWVSASSSTTAAPASPIHPSAAPAFRTAGWTSLDTGSSQPFPPSPPTSLPPPPLPAAPAPPFSRGSWLTVPATRQPPSATAWSTVVPPIVPPNDPPPPLPFGGPPRPPSPPQPSHTQSPAPAPAAQPIRSGWQQFQKTGPKRR